MRLLARTLFGTLALVSALAACGGHQGSLPPLDGGNRAPLAVANPLAVVQSATAMPSSQVSSVSLQLGTAPIVGDLLLASIQIDSGKTVTTPSGWTVVDSSLSASTSLYVMYRIVQSGDGVSYTFTGSSADWMSGALREIEGENASNPISGHAIAAISASQMPNASVSATPGVTGVLPIASFVANSGMGVTAHTAGWTENYSAYPSTTNGNGFAPAYNGTEGQAGPLASGTGAISATATWNLSSNNGPVGIAQLTLIAPAAVATPTPTPTPAPTGAPGALSVVQTIDATPSAQVGSVSLQLGTAPAVGDLLLASIQIDSGKTVTTPAGWTLIDSSLGAGTSLYVMYHVVQAGDGTTYAFTGSSADWMSGGLREIKGENASNPISGHAIAAIAGSQMPNASVSATPGVTGVLPLASFIANSAMGVTAHTAGWTENYSAYPSSTNGDGFAPAYNATEGQTGPQASGTGAISATATWNVTANNGPVGIAQLTLVAPAPLATPTPSPTPTPAPTQTPTPAPTGSPGAVSVVQTIDATPSAQVGSVSLQLVTAPAVGNLLLASIQIDSGKTVTTPSGWTVVDSSLSASTSLYVMYRIVQNGDGVSYTFTGSSADWMSGALREIKGENATSPISGHAIAAISASQMPNASVSANAAVIGVLPIASFVANSGMGVTAHTAGWTETYSSYPSTTNGNGFAPAYNATEGQTGPVASGTGAITATATWNLSSNSGPVGIAQLTLVAPASGVTPSPTPAPTATPTSPASAPWQNFTKIVNGQPYPPPGFIPYSSTSPWNQLLPASPKFYADPITGTSGDSILATSENKEGNNQALGSYYVDNTYSAQGDYSHPIYLASATDPVVTYTCTNKPFCGGTLLASATFRIPANALPASGGDSHLITIQPDGTEYDCWSVQKGQNPFQGTTQNPGKFIATSCAQFTISGSGWEAWPGGTANWIPVSQANEGSAGAAGAGMATGMVSYSEAMVPGGFGINHALYGILGCSDPNVVVYPATHADGACGYYPAIPYGARIWSDLTPAQILGQAPLPSGVAFSHPLALWEQSVFIALNRYGSYMADTGGGAPGGIAVAVQMDSSSQYIAFNTKNPWYAYEQSLGITPTPGLDRFDFGDPWLPSAGITGIYAHLHIVDPCVTRMTC